MGASLSTHIDLLNFAQSAVSNLYKVELSYQKAQDVPCSIIGLGQTPYICSLHQYPEISFDLCFNAGVVGVENGIDHYNEEKGYQVATVIIWWIRQAIARAARKHRK